MRPSQSSTWSFAFAVRIADATRQRDDAVVGQHVAIERIEGRIVDVGREHALFQVVEHDHFHRAAEATEGALVQLTPDRGARPLRDKPAFKEAFEAVFGEPLELVTIRKSDTPVEAEAKVDKPPNGTVH